MKVKAEKVDVRCRQDVAMSRISQGFLFEYTDTFGNTKKEVPKLLGEESNGVANFLGDDDKNNNNEKSPLAVQTIWITHVLKTNLDAEPVSEKTKTAGSEAGNDKLQKGDPAHTRDLGSAQLFTPQGSRVRGGCLTYGPEGVPDVRQREGSLIASGSPEPERVR
ncbi:hypothetical protein R1sor_000527 [Riccia sorocarpa]|uniref:Uncharacterized protein n=1 Tax=Riccia sorocarpa TaxID=122646 RepID=A0ABD3GWI3_9MARC